MAQTTVATGSNLNVLKAVPRVLDMYMTKDNIWAICMGREDEVAIKILDELAERHGDNLRGYIFDMLNQAPISGDNTLEGSEEAMVWSADTVNILQARNAVLLGGMMTLQRSEVDLASMMVKLLGQWLKNWVTVLLTYTASGARGVRTAPILGTGFTGWGTNGLQAPDAAHILYGAQATSSANLTPGDKFSVDVIYRAAAALDNLFNANRPMRPTLELNGNVYFPWYISPQQARDLKRDPMYINAQNLARERGRDNPMFTGFVGTFDQFAFLINPFAVQFNTYGAAGNMLADRSVILGSEAMLFAQAPIPAGGGFSYDAALQGTGVFKDEQPLDPRQKQVGARDISDDMDTEQPAKSSVVMKAFDYANQLGCAYAVMLGAKKMRVDPTLTTDHATFTVDTAISAA